MYFPIVIEIQPTLFSFLKSETHMLTFHALSSRVLRRWLQATARWKVETHSNPTRCWSPLSALYTQCYDRHSPERKMYTFLKNVYIFARNVRKPDSILWNLTTYWRIFENTVDFPWFSLNFIDFHWISLIFIDFHWISLISTHFHRF